ncbi:ribosomal maturation YjgA family protein [Scytonema millei]|uniref:DUF2809 domain-containing protein n=1 Tax=Scytonema millei VB511283 TaxID=1245923 RepID=A0A9X5E225_9CYAN|nr:DUF2809 domain-containing protein [Scytonema millei]NHC33408.1 DUF2809 domain-containing protein [Scytonema millei VB511283]
MRSPATQTAYIIISLLVVTTMGFLFKFYTGFAQEWFNNYIAAVFYEIFWCLLAFLFWRSSNAIARIPIWVFTITCGIEFLQLWHPPLLEKIRSTFIGRTLLGSTFSLWDFPHYVLGCFLGWLWLQQLKVKGHAKKS